MCVWILPHHILFRCLGLLSHQQSAGEGQSWEGFRAEVLFSFFYNIPFTQVCRCQSLALILTTPFLLLWTITSLEIWFKKKSRAVKYFKLKTCIWIHGFEWRKGASGTSDLPQSLILFGRGHCFCVFCDQCSCAQPLFLPHLYPLASVLFVSWMKVVISYMFVCWFSGSILSYQSVLTPLLFIRKPSWAP